MPNRIKFAGSGNGHALQVTNPAVRAGLAERVDEEDRDDEPLYRDLAAVRVYGFDELMLVVDPEDLAPTEILDLVSAAVRDTGSFYEAIDAKVQLSGHGTMVTLPGIEHTGFDVGDRAPVHSAPGLLVITTEDRSGQRLAKDVVEIRRAQVDNL